jgi:hypothetical protein
VGLRCGLRKIQLRPLQLDDLWIHTLAEPVALGLATPDRVTGDATADADATADKEALKQDGNSSLDSAA